MSDHSTKKRVLVMDDSEIVLETVKAVFAANGFDVCAVANLNELEMKWQTYQPDVFILDVQMPEAFGDDVGQLLKDVRGVGVPILLFSSLDEGMLAQRARDAGLTGYVPKAEGVPALLSRVVEVLG